MDPDQTAPKEQSDQDPHSSSVSEIFVKPTIQTRSHHIWALMQENLSLGVCKQQRRRPASASAQPDQHLCYLLSVKYHI